MFTCKDWGNSRHAQSKLSKFEQGTAFMQLSCFTGSSEFVRCHPINMNHYRTEHFKRSILCSGFLTVPLIGALQTHTTDTFLFISHTKNVLLFKFHCNILIGVRIIKEMPGSVASGTHCIMSLWVNVQTRGRSVLLGVYLNSLVVFPFFPLRVVVVIITIIIIIVIIKSQPLFYNHTVICVDESYVIQLLQ